MCAYIEAQNEPILTDNEKIMFDPQSVLTDSSNTEVLNGYLHYAKFIYGLNNSVKNIALNEPFDIKSTPRDFFETIESTYKEHLNTIITTNVNALINEYPEADIKSNSVFAAESVERYAQRVDPSYIFIRGLARFTSTRGLSKLGSKDATIFFDRSTIQLNKLYYMLKILQYARNNSLTSIQTLIVLYLIGVGDSDANNDTYMNMKVYNINFDSLINILESNETRRELLRACSKNETRYLNNSQVSRYINFLFGTYTYTLTASNVGIYVQNIYKNTTQEMRKMILEFDNIFNLLSFVHSSGFVKVIDALNNSVLNEFRSYIKISEINDSSNFMCKLRNLAHSFVYNLKRLHGSSLWIADARGGAAISTNVSETELDINDNLFDEILETTSEMNARIAQEQSNAEAERLRLQQEAETERLRLQQEAVDAAVAEAERIAQEEIDAADALRVDAERKLEEAVAETERLRKEMEEAAVEAQRIDQEEDEAQRLAHEAEIERIHAEYKAAEQKRTEEEERAKITAEEAERVRIAAEKTKEEETKRAIAELQQLLDDEKKKYEEAERARKEEEERKKQEENERLKNELLEQQKKQEELLAQKQKELEQKSNESSGLSTGSVIAIILIILIVIGGGAFLMMQKNRPRPNGYIQQRPPNMNNA